MEVLQAEGQSNNGLKQCCMSLCHTENRFVWHISILLLFPNFLCYTVINCRAVLRGLRLFVFVLGGKWVVSEH